MIQLMLKTRPGQPREASYGRVTSGWMTRNAIPHSCRRWSRSTTCSKRLPARRSAKRPLGPPSTSTRSRAPSSRSGSRRGLPKYFGRSPPQSCPQICCLFTVGRLVDTGIENQQALRGIARIRSYYRTLTPEGAVYFSAESGRWPEARAAPLWAGSFVAF